MGLTNYPLLGKKKYFSEHHFYLIIVNNKFQSNYFIHMLIYFNLSFKPMKFTIKSLQKLLSMMNCLCMTQRSIATSL